MTTAPIAPLKQFKPQNRERTRAPTDQDEG
jgi:hypothetical protein